MDADNATPGTEETETVRKIYVKELREKQSLTTVFKVTHKARQTGRSGKAFLVLRLGDRTGEVDGRIFDKADALEPRFVEGDYVLLTGNVISWQKRLQLVIDHLERLDPEPIDPAEFAVPPAPVKLEAPAEAARPEQPRETGREDKGRPDAARAVAQIRELVDRVHDGHVKALLIAVLEDDDIARGLASAPAAKGVHHAYKGGLAEHILSVMRLAQRVCDHYPMVDRDLVLAGALLHDVYKVKEILPEKGGGFEYSDEGRLVGHLVMAAQQIALKASQLPGFPRALEHHLTHIVLAHHGQLDWGSPKEPMTLEALLVHLIDTIDSRVASWLEIMDRDPGETWTDSKNLYGRHLWKGAVPTGRGRAPTEGRTPRRQRQRQRGKGGGAQAQAGQGHERERERDRERAATPGVPTFKPFDQLAAQAPAPAEEPAPTPNEQAPSGE